MDPMLVTPEELLEGGTATHEVEVPPDVLRPTSNGSSLAEGESRRIVLRPLLVKDIHLIAKAAKGNEVLTSVLMIEKSVVEPELRQAQISQMHSGLIRFLVDHINRISGLSTSEDDLNEIADSPLVKTFFVLAKEFGWTPQQVREMTVAQILGYLELLNQAKHQE